MTFPLQILTPDGLCYDGEAERLDVRTTQGEIGILPQHIDYLAALGMGVARVVADGKTRRAACIGGMVSVSGGAVRLLATTFEWEEQIDLDRAKEAERRAREKLAERNRLSEEELRLAEAKLKRALVRESAAASVGNALTAKR